MLVMVCVIFGLRSLPDAEKHPFAENPDLRGIVLAQGQTERLAPDVKSSRQSRDG